MIYVPRTQLTCIFEGQPSKKARPFSSKNKGRLLGSRWFQVYYIWIIIIPCWQSNLAKWSRKCSGCWVLYDQTESFLECETQPTSKWKWRISWDPLSACNLILANGKHLKMDWFLTWRACRPWHCHHFKETLHQIHRPSATYSVLVGGMEVGGSNIYVQANPWRRLSNLPCAIWLRVVTYTSNKILWVYDNTSP